MYNEPWDVVSSCVASCISVVAWIPTKQGGIIGRRIYRKLCARRNQWYCGVDVLNGYAAIWCTRQLTPYNKCVVFEHFFIISSTICIISSLFMIFIVKCTYCKIASRSTSCLVACLNLYWVRHASKWDFIIQNMQLYEYKHVSFSDMSQFVLSEAC